MITITCVKCGAYRQDEANMAMLRALWIAGGWDVDNQLCPACKEPEPEPIDMEFVEWVCERAGDIRTWCTMVLYFAAIADKCGSGTTRQEALHSLRAHFIKDK